MRTLETRDRIMTSIEANRILERRRKSMVAYKDELNGWPDHAKILLNGAVIAKCRRGLLDDGFALRLERGFFNHLK